MAIHPPARILRDRLHRRSIRVSPTGMSVLPDLRPVVPRPAAAPPPPGPRRSVQSLMVTVIAAVNARGMCAAHAARVAELPVDEVDHIEALCGCSCCRKLRAH